MKRTVFLSIILLLNLSQGRPQDSCAISWGSIVQISHDSALSVVPQALASGDTVHLLWHGNVTPGVYNDSGLGIIYSRSIDGGGSFSPQRRLVTYDSARGGRGYLAASEENLYLMYHARVDSPIYTNVGLLRSTDAGVSWLPRQVLGGVDPRAIAAHDSGVYIYFVWVENNFGHSGFLISHDYGVTWDSVHLPTRIRSASFVKLFCTSTTLHLIRQRGFNGPQETLHNRSTDFGYTWSEDDTLSKNDGWDSQVARISGDAKGNLYVIWSDGEYGGGFSGTIIMRRSTDDGVTWLPEQIISQLATAGFCDISVEGSVVGVIWDTEVTYYVHKIETRFSLDGGSTWLEATTIADSGGDPTIAVARERIHASWWNTANTNDVYYRQGKFGPASVETLADLPKAITLGQNYPNPFNSSTMIRFSLPKAGRVSLKVYNVLGQVVATLADGMVEAGEHVLRCNASNLPTGVYFYRLEAESTIRTKKLILLK